MPGGIGLKGIQGLGSTADRRISSAIRSGRCRDHLRGTLSRGDGSRSLASSANDAESDRATGAARPTVYKNINHSRIGHGTAWVSVCEAFRM